MEMTHPSTIKPPINKMRQRSIFPNFSRQFQQFDRSKRKQKKNSTHGLRTTIPPTELQHRRLAANFCNPSLTIVDISPFYTLTSQSAIHAMYETSFSFAHSQLKEHAMYRWLTCDRLETHLQVYFVVEMHYELVVLIKKVNLFFFFLKTSTVQMRQKEKQSAFIK